jgi:hypothetical protein
LHTENGAFPGFPNELDSIRRLLLAANCLIRFGNELFQPVEDVIGLENETVGGTEEKSRVIKSAD